FAPSRASRPLLIEVEGGCGELRIRHSAPRQVTSEPGAVLLDVLNLWGVLRGPIEGCGLGLLHGNRYIELRDEGGKSFVGQLLFGVGCVARLRGADSEAFDGHGKDDGRTALVLC